MRETCIKGRCLSDGCLDQEGLSRNRVRYIGPVVGEPELNLEKKNTIR